MAVGGGGWLNFLGPFPLGYTPEYDRTMYRNYKVVILFII